MKVRPLGDEWLHRASGRTGMTKPIVAFRNFANTQKNEDLDVPGCCALPSGTILGDRRVQREC